MDEIVICKSCFKFMDENKHLKKTIKQLKGEIKAFDLTPNCVACGNRMEKENAKSFVTEFRIKVYNSWVCKPCQKKAKDKKIELDVNIN